MVLCLCMSLSVSVSVNDSGYCITHYYNALNKSGTFHLIALTVSTEVKRLP